MMDYAPDREVRLPLGENDGGSSGGGQLIHIGRTGIGILSRVWRRRINVIVPVDPRHP